MNKKESSHRKTVPIPVRLTQAEAESFKLYCEKNGTTRARMQRKIIRELITGKPDLMTPEMDAFKDSVRKLAGISTNLNQLTRAVNSGKVPPRLLESDYWQVLISNVGSLRDALDAVIDATETRWVSDSCHE